MNTPEKKQIITIGGRPGSGKSTTARNTADLLGYDRFSSGDFFRAVAKRRGITIEELNRIAEEDSSIDREVDQELQKLGETGVRLVIDSRLAFHWIPHSFKVFLNISPEMAAERIFADKDEMRLTTSEKVDSIEEMAVRIEERFQSERKRYKELYELDPYDPHHFDLVIDTGNNPPDAVAERIVQEFTKWLQT